MVPDLLFKLCIYPLYLLLSWISCIFPRNKNIWVFGSWFGRSYSDNSRYVFEYVCLNESSIRAVWLTHEEKVLEQVHSAGGEAYLINSLMGYLMSYRVALVFLTCGSADVNPVASFGAIKIQLWHGTPLKKIGLDDQITTNPNQSSLYKALKILWRTLFPFTSDKYDLIISASPLVSKRLATAFGVAPSQIKVTGYPRADLILSPKPLFIPAVEAFRKKYNARYVICYFPTHRGEGYRDINLFENFDIEGLNDCLSRHEAVFFIKLHYYHKNYKMSLGSDIESSRICWLSDDEVNDVNQLLTHIDLLITDYSSVYFDYLLLDRPIIFAPFDIDSYITYDREFYEDYDLATPGPKCKNWHELIVVLDRTLSGVDSYGELRKLKQRLYNSYVDTNNCKRIIEEAKNLIKNI